LNPQTLVLSGKQSVCPQSSLGSPKSYNSIFFKILALPKGKEKSSEIGNTSYLPSVSINFYQKDIRLNNAKE